MALPVAFTGGPYVTIAEADLPQNVNLDGTTSSVGDGTTITAYSWKLAKPAGSSAALDDPAAATPVLQNVDVWGTYAVFLVVTNDIGQTSKAAPREAPDSAFAWISVKATTDDLEKPAPGQRGWDDEVNHAITKLKALREAFDGHTHGAGDITLPDPILVDVINERTLNAGVTIEGVEVKNGGVRGPEIAEFLEVRDKGLTIVLADDGAVSPATIASSVTSETLFAEDGTPLALQLPILITDNLEIEWEAMFALEGAMDSTLQLRARFSEIAGDLVAQTFNLASGAVSGTIIRLRGTILIADPNGPPVTAHAASEWRSSSSVHGPLLLSGSYGGTPLDYGSSLAFSAEWGGGSDGTKAVRFRYAVARVRRRATV